MGTVRCTDDLCAYQTVKMVKIRDRRLGFMKYVLMFAIAVYILVYQVVYQCKYLKMEAPVGTVRFSLREPTMGFYKNGTATGCPSCCDTVKNYADYTCNNTLSPLDSYPYCRQHNNESSKSTYPCVYWDAIEIKKVQDKSVIITTHVQTVKQVRANCSEGTQTCPQIWVNQNDPVDNYIAGIDAYTLLVDHAIGTPTLGIEATSRNMSGRLYSNNDTLCAYSTAFSTATGSDSTSTAPCYIEPNQNDHLDYFTISTLLAAGEIDLDALSAKGHSFRYYGAVVLLEITYANSEPWVGTHGWEGRKRVSYVYKVSVLPSSSYKFESPTYGINVDHGDSTYPTSTLATREVRTKYGIRFAVLQQGQLGIPDFLTLLVSLTTSLGLIALATVAVDFLATNVLKDKKHYKAAKVEETKAFGATSLVDGFVSVQPFKKSKESTLEGGSVNMPANEYEDDIPLIRP